MNMKVTIREDTWPYIDEFFQKVPAAFQKLLTIREAFEKHAEQVAARAVVDGGIQAQQQTRLLVLRHRFREVPIQIIKQIDNMRDRQLLNRWLEQALDAETINQINFASAPQT